MKTSVSIPDEVFAGAERLARRLKKSRSRLYAEALAEYVRRHNPDEVTDALNATVDDLRDSHDAFVTAAGRCVLRRSKW